MKPFLHPVALCVMLWPLPGHAAPLDLPERPGTFWLQLDSLPGQPREAIAQVDAVRFTSLAELTEHALRERPESRTAWFGIQAEAARLDAAAAANWPTLTGQLSFIQSRSLSSFGTSAPTLHRWELPGEVERHETPEQSLRRELYEEFGIEAEVGSFICSSTYDYPHGLIELVAYRVSHLSGEFALNDHEEIMWVTPAEMGEYDFAPADIPIVQRLQSGE